MEDPIELIKKEDEDLEALDTFHDFCTKERKKKSAAKVSGGDEDDEDVSEGKLEEIRAYIGTYLKGRLELATNSLPAIIKYLTNDNVTSFSDFENKIVAYYEATQAKPLNVDKGEREYITFTDIVDGWDDTLKENSPLWRKYRLNRDTNTVLEVNKGIKSIEKFTQGERNIIGNFLMNYFFGTSQGQMKCTFDAKAGVVSKIFEDIDQMRNVIFPQTIADSATTTFSTMKGRNDFVFPTVKTFPFVSNFYSKQDYAISFRNKGFDNKNPYGFSIDIKKLNEPGKNTTLELPFSASQTEGPSVNYLIDIVLKAKKSANPAQERYGDIEKKKNILSLGKYLDANNAFKANLVTKIKANTEGLPFDLKRGGDHEAAAVAQYMRLVGLFVYIIFVTIDLLCALESRRRGNPTIWHYGERMICYRFPVILSPEALQANKKRNTLDKIKDAIQSLLIIKRMKTDVTDQLTKLKKEATLGKAAFVDVKGTQGAYNVQMACEKLLTFLLRKRMEQLEREVTEILAILPTIYLEEDIKEDIDTSLELFRSILTDPRVLDIVEPDNYLLAGIPLTSRFQQVDKLLKEYSEFINTKLKCSIPIGVTINIDLNPRKYIQVYTYIVNCKQIKDGKNCDINSPEDSVYVFTENSNTALDYDADCFFKFYKICLEIAQATTKANAEGKNESRVYVNFMKNSLSNLKKVIQDVLDQFPKEVQESLKVTSRLLDIENADVYKEEYSTFIEYLPKQADPVRLLRRGAIGKLVQQGGAADPQQFYDCADLLFDISSRASVFIESAYTQLYPVQAFQCGLDELENFEYWFTVQYNLLYKNVMENVSNEDKLKASMFFNARESYLFDFENTLLRAQQIFEKNPTMFRGALRDDTAYFKELLYSNLAKTSIEDEIEELFYIIHDNTIESLTQIKNSFNRHQELKSVLNYIPPARLHKPSLSSFFNDLISDPDLMDAADLVKEDIQQTWEKAIYNLQMSSSYQYERNLTEKYITQVLSLQANGVYNRFGVWQQTRIDSQYIILNEGVLSEEFKKNYTYFPNVLNHAQKNISIPILMVFTLLENVQNPNKFSYFLEDGYLNQYFNSQSEWNDKLYQYLTNMMPTIWANFDFVNKKFRPIQKELEGGKRRSKYAKKTHRQAKRAKRNKRMTKRRKH